MYRLIALLLLVFFSSPGITAGNGLPDTVTVLGKTLTSAYSKGNDEMHLTEYIPKQETLDSWTLMYAVRSYQGENLDPRASVLGTAQNIKKRKEAGDPVANSAVFQGDDGSFAIDFLVSEKDIGLEHNIFKYIKTDDGMVSLQVARRIYLKNSTQDEVNRFIKAIPELRKRILKELDSSILPKK